VGTAIGNAWGWRATMWFVTALAAVVVSIIALRLPRLRSTGAPGLRQRLAPLTDVRLVRVLAGTLLAFVGIYLPYTYISAVFAPALGGDDSRVAVLLLAFGVAGTVGNLVAGKLADRYGPRRVVVTATLVLTAVFLVMPPTRGVLAWVVPVVALAGFCSWSVTTPQQHRAIALSPAGAGPLAVSLNASVLYLNRTRTLGLGRDGETTTGSTSDEAGGEEEHGDKHRGRGVWRCVFHLAGHGAGISFLEAPLKFRAPGVTPRLGLGIGRVVFRALNRVELALLVVALVAAGITAFTA
jgi:MFS family permease